MNERIKFIEMIFVDDKKGWQPVNPDDLIVKEDKNLCPYHIEWRDGILCVIEDK